jgi:hypothetical protein
MELTPVDDDRTQFRPGWGWMASIARLKAARTLP